MTPKIGASQAATPGTFVVVGRDTGKRKQRVRVLGHFEGRIVLVNADYVMPQTIASVYDARHRKVWSRDV